MSIHTPHPDDLAASLEDLCSRGLVTCTSGRPGEPDATYALARKPLDAPLTFTEHVRRLHERNRRALRLKP